jgi:hypothetical protein
MIHLPRMVLREPINKKYMIHYYRFVESSTLTCVCFVLVIADVGSEILIIDLLKALH